MSEQTDAEPIDYLERVERHFSRRRGGPLVLSPRDYQLVKKWQERGLPAQVVLQGINRAFDRFDAGTRRPDRINSLTYCKQHVEEAWQEHRELESTQAGRDSQAPLAAAARHLEMVAASCESAAGAMATAASMPAAADAVLTTAARALRELAVRVEGSRAGVRELDEEALALESSTLEALREALPASATLPSLPRFSPWA